MPVMVWNRSSGSKRSCALRSASGNSDNFVSLLPLSEVSYISASRVFGCIQLLKMVMRKKRLALMQSHGLALGPSWEIWLVLLVFISLMVLSSGLDFRCGGRHLHRFHQGLLIATEGLGDGLAIAAQALEHPLVY
jgi:hypothetical protein